MVYNNLTLKPEEGSQGSQTFVLTPLVIQLAPLIKRT